MNPTAAYVYNPNASRFDFRDDNFDSLRSISLSLYALARSSCITIGNKANAFAYKLLGCNNQKLRPGRTFKMRHYKL